MKISDMDDHLGDRRRKQSVSLENDVVSFRNWNTRLLQCRLFTQDGVDGGSDPRHFVLCFVTTTIHDSGTIVL